MFVSDLSLRTTAERRHQGQLNRSSSLLDLSASRRTRATDPRRSAGPQLPRSSAKPVPDSQSEVNRHVGDVKTGGQETSRNIQHRRVTLDVTTSRQLPRTLSCY